MNIGLNSIKIDKADALIIPVFEDGKEEMIEILSELFKHAKEKDKFTGKHGEVFTSIKAKKTKTQDIIFVGLGKEKEITGEKIRIAMAKALKKAREIKAESIYVKYINSAKLKLDVIMNSMVEGFYFGDYKFDKYKTDRKDQPCLDISIDGIDNANLEKAEACLAESKTLAEATLFARDLVNEPANVMTPQSFAEKAKESGEEYGFEVEVHDEKQVEELGMKAFLAVAKGSVNPPRLIVMRYFGDKDNSKDVLGFVGKGLMYDAGGYSIKPTDSMVDMKSDMAGAAAVLGAMSAIAQKGLKVNVVAVVAACENLISGGAYKPGDIIGSMGGKNIEVLNTDAEGRLTLADAVTYIIAKEKVSKVVDLATLTGAVLVALGTTTTGVVTNNEKFYKELKKAADQSEEKVWLLPSFDEYKEMLKSDIADLKNSTGRNAGSICAGLFIGEFAKDTPWLHLDIAGTSWMDTGKDYLSKGGTGVGVRTLYYLAKDRG